MVKVTTSAYGHRARDRLAGDEADEVRRVDHQPGADLVRDRAERREVDQPRVRRRAADDHLRLVLMRQFADLVVVDQLVVLAHPVSDGVEPLAGEVDLAAVGQVAAVRQAHREHGVARCEQCRVGRQVGAGAGMRLQVGMVGAEECLGPLDPDLLGPVDHLATAVITPAGIALGVLVRQCRAECGEHRRRGEVLAGDQLKAAAQPLELVDDDRGDLGVGGRQRGEIGPPERGRIGHLSAFIPPDPAVVVEVRLLYDAPGPRAGSRRRVRRPCDAALRHPQPAHRNLSRRTQVLL